MMVELRTVQYDNTEIEYSLERKEVKNLNLRIRKDGSVWVSVNPIVDAHAVDDFVAGKGSYILSVKQHFAAMAQYQPSPKRYVSGESFVILGHGLRLDVSQGTKNEISSDGVYLRLKVTDTADFSLKQRIVGNYLDQQRKAIFADLLDEIYPLFRKYEVAFPKIRIRDMDTRWGSCLPDKGIITLNKRLLEVPRDCIEYVIMHEMCHFVQPNHSKKYYAFLSMLMPDWKIRKTTLDKFAEYGL